MRKRILLVFVITMVLFSTSCHKHEWIEATCTEPKTCAECGETEGEPLGHEWTEATCTRPKTCTRCGETEGVALGHVVDEWTTAREATCSETGIESGTCKVCNEVVEQEIPTVPHTPGDWEITETPTKNSQGTRVKRCTVCGAEVESEKFSLSEEELKQLYIGECKTISYDKLCRTPGDYEGQKIKVSGRVLQVCSEASSALYYSTYRIATSGRWDNVVYVKIDNYGSGNRILEDDYITVYGTYDGIYTYTTVQGSALSIPSVRAEYYE